MPTHVDYDGGTQCLQVRRGRLVRERKTGSWQARLQQLGWRASWAASASSTAGAVAGANGETGCYQMEILELSDRTTSPWPGRARSGAGKLTGHVTVVHLYADIKRFECHRRPLCFHIEVHRITDLCTACVCVAIRCLKVGLQLSDVHGSLYTYCPTLRCRSWNRLAGSSFKLIVFFPLI